MKDESINTMTAKDMEALIGKTVMNTLVVLGIDHKDPLEMQKDFQHLREFRLSTEAIKRKGVATLVGMFIVSIMGAILVGVKEFFK